MFHEVTKAKSHQQPQITEDRDNSATNAKCGITNNTKLYTLYERYHMHKYCSFKSVVYISTKIFQKINNLHITLTDVN